MNLGAAYIDVAGMKMANEREKVLEKGERLLQESLEVTKKSYGEDHLEVSNNALVKLSHAYRALKKNDENIEVLNQALDIQEKVFQTRKHHDIAAILVNLGEAYVDKSNINLGKKKVEEALRIERELYGDETPNVAKILEHLSLLYAVERNWDASLIELDNALLIKKKLYPKKHIEIDNTLDNLCVLYMKWISELIRQGDSKAEALENIFQREIHKSIEHPIALKRAINSMDGFLIFAASRGQLEIVKVLLKHDADVNFINIDGISALSASVQHGHSETAVFLLKNGADFNHLNEEQKTQILEFISARQETHIQSTSRFNLSGDTTNISSDLWPTNIYPNKAEPFAFSNLWSIRWKEVSNQLPAL